MQKLLKKFKNKKVIVTGHTGFKGSWLALWLHLHGAKVMGLSNKILTDPSHFRSIKLKEKIISKKVDICDIDKMKKIFLNFKPDFVFHLAAQAIVKKSYINPVETYKSNTLGTLSILECLRSLKNKCVVVLITSDKSYKNLELQRGYKEDDLLGGLDPYSSSKASAELIIQAYLNSFLKYKKNILLAVARAGNVIGGGDWSDERLIPDCVKSWSKKKEVVLRNPNSTRPWQHVLEALSGYLILSIKLLKNKKFNGETFNFGPSNHNNYSVLDVVKIMKKNWKRVSWKIQKKNKFYFESDLLKLNSNKAMKKLNWKSVLTFAETINLVINWYKNYYNKKKDIHKETIAQMRFYEKIFMERIK